jgi:hypothetical protein
LPNQGGWGEWNTYPALEGSEMQSFGRTSQEIRPLHVDRVWEG